MKKTLGGLVLLLVFLVVVTCGVFLYLYYGIGERFQEENTDTGGEEITETTGTIVSETGDPSLSDFEEEFYTDLSDLFNTDENFYEEIQGEYGFTS